MRNVKSQRKQKHQVLTQTSPNCNTAVFNVFNIPILREGVGATGLCAYWAVIYRSCICYLFAS